MRLQLDFVILLTLIVFLDYNKIYKHINMRCYVDMYVFFLILLIL